MMDGGGNTLRHGALRSQLWTAAPARGAELDAAALRTGDMLFFHADSLPAAIIQWSGHCAWSHVGLVAAYASPGAPGGRRLGLWEAVSTPAGQYSVLDGALRAGVRLVDLHERLAHMAPGTVGVRQLSFAPPADRGAFEAALYRCIAAENGKPYEPSVWTLVLSWLDCGGAFACFNNARDTSAYFCSELVAETLMQAALLRPIDASAEFTVGDLAFLPNTPNTLAPGAHYDGVRVLRWDVRALTLTAPGPPGGGSTL